MDIYETKLLSNHGNRSGLKDVIVAHFEPGSLLQKSGVQKPDVAYATTDQFPALYKKRSLDGTSVSS